MKKLATSVRITPEAKRLLKLLAEALGISQAAVLELAIRQMAKRGGYLK
jgi:predicted transcriptional regulator